MKIFRFLPSRYPPNKSVKYKQISEYNTFTHSAVQVYHVKSKEPTFKFCSFSLRVGRVNGRISNRAKSWTASAISAQILPTKPQDQHQPIQGSCEWFKHDLEVLWVKLQRIFQLKVAVRISALFELRPFTLPATFIYFVNWTVGLAKYGKWPNYYEPDCKVWHKIW